MKPKEVYMRTLLHSFFVNNAMWKNMQKYKYMRRDALSCNMYETYLGECISETAFFLLNNVNNIEVCCCIRLCYELKECMYKVRTCCFVYSQNGHQTCFCVYNEFVNSFIGRHI